MSEILDAVKLALRVSADVFDNEINDLIEAAKSDLGIVGVENAETDPLIKRAIITYCRLYFGEPDDFDRMKAAYDEQKAQLITATGYGMPEVVEDGQK